MKLAIFTHLDDQKLHTLMQSTGCHDAQYCKNPTQIDSTIDYIVSLGGDGTLLDTVHKIMNNPNTTQIPPLLGINSGRLGFLTAANITQIAQTIKLLDQKKYKIENRDLLIINQNTLALNEIIAQRSGVEMVQIDLEIDGTKVAKYWADGVIVATPTGSTAYSMSVGGAIIAPQTKCTIISPIAPHNLSLRPLVVPNSAQINVTVSARNQSQIPLITADNKKLPQTKTLNIKTAPQQLKLITFEDKNFYNTITEKLNWGADPRQ